MRGGGTWCGGLWFQLSPRETPAIPEGHAAPPPSWSVTLSSPPRGLWRLCPLGLNHGEKSFKSKNFSRTPHPSVPQIQPRSRPGPWCNLSAQVPQSPNGAHSTSTPQLPSRPRDPWLPSLCGPQASFKSSHHRGSAQPHEHPDDIRNLWTMATLSETHVDMPLSQVCDKYYEEVKVPGHKARRRSTLKDSWKDGGECVSLKDKVSFKAEDLELSTSSSLQTPLVEETSAELGQ